jgi:hypothetical protein
MTIWNDYVKEYAAKKGIAYMVAASDPKCKSAYEKSKEKTLKKPILKEPKEKVEKLPKTPKNSPKVPKVAKIPKESTKQLKGKLFSDII